MRWSDSAKQALSEHIKLTREQLLLTGADPDEVEEDLRSHIDETAKRQGAEFITVDNVEAVIGKIKIAQTGEKTSPQNRTKNKKSWNQVDGKIKSWTLAWTLMFGVIIPLTAYILELSTGICNQLLFDPMPNWINVAGVGFVILFNFYSWRLLARGSKPCCSYKWLFRANAVVCGLCIYYMLQFIPVMPFALIGTIFLLGLLPLCPYLAFWVTLRFRFLFPSPAHERKGFFLMALLGFLLMFITDIPRIITYSVINSTNNIEEISQTQITLLRRIGDEGILEDLCSMRTFNNNGNIYRLLFSYDFHNRDLAQKVYYLVTGTAYKGGHSKRPKGIRRGFDFDFGQGSDKVGEYIDGLKLFSSRLDSSIDADGGIAYTEWTIEFQNNDKFQEREARSRIMLPEGSVVSRLTLWINGEECEAAFAGKGQVTKAYKSVVRRLRDPVLVTTSGDNQIRMQCYPVPPNGGKMKLRIGITTPLLVKNRDEVYFNLPLFSDRNFNISKNLNYNLWLESQHKLNFNGLVANKKHNGKFRLIKELTQQELLTNYTVSVARNSKIEQAWTKDKNGKIITQEIVKVPLHQKIVAVVIDGSVSMKNFKDNIYQALNTVKNRPQNIYQIGRKLQMINLENLSDIETHYYQGGYDNLPTLKKAWLFASKQGGAVLWIHGIQPVEITPVTLLKQIMDRDDQNTPFYDYSVDSKQNIISESLQHAPNYHVLRGKFKNILSKYCGDNKNFAWRRNKVSSLTTFNPANSKQTSDHLLRLWANDRVKQLLKTKSRKAAIQLAIDYRIVTPVTGAVVLENKAQYDANNLTPVDSNEVPTIPEPETWLMIIICLIFFYYFIYRKKRICL